MAATPKPRLVKLSIAPQGEGQVFRCRLRVQGYGFCREGGTGWHHLDVAPLLGKKPADTKAWVVRGEAPVFAKAGQSLYASGPVLQD